MKIFNRIFVLAIIITSVFYFNCQQAADKNNDDSGGSGGGPTDYNAMVTAPAITDFPMGYAGVGIPVHTVPSISSFKISKYEITYERWYTVKQWALTHGYTIVNPGNEGFSVYQSTPTARKLEPVTAINWRDCIIWCNAASQYEGFTPVYYTNVFHTSVLKVSTNTGSIDTTLGSEDNPYVDWSADGYRLPTEAEWEACARYINGTSWLNGTYASGATADYSDFNATNLVSWWEDNTTSTKNVGIKKNNGLVIYDMSGNVWEWCWDWYGVYTALSPYTDSDPKGNVYDPVSPRRMARGGSWFSSNDYMQVSYRSSVNPYGRYDTFGFRAARTIP